MTALRVATYNLLSGRDIRFNRFDLDAAAAAIDGLEADVVAVQEVDRGLERSGGVHQVEELAALLGWTGVFAPALLGDPTLRWTRGPGADPDPGTPRDLVEATRTMSAREVASSLLQDVLSDAAGRALGERALFSEDLRVDLPHVLAGLARLARHRRPHLELLDRLVQGVRHDERLRVLEHEVAERDRQERAVDVP